MNEQSYHRACVQGISSGSMMTHTLVDQNQVFFSFDRSHNFTFCFQFLCKVNIHVSEHIWPLYVFANARHMHKVEKEHCQCGWQCGV